MIFDLIEAFLAGAIAGLVLAYVIAERVVRKAFCKLLKEANLGDPHDR